MKKNVFLAAIATAAFTLLLSSCASYQKTAPVFGITTNNVNTYVKADLDLSNAKRVEGIVEKKTVLWFIQLSRNGNKTLVESNRYQGAAGMFSQFFGGSKLKAQALYRAKESGNVDLIIEPEYEIEKHNFLFGLYKTQMVKAKGWGVNVKGLKEDNVTNPAH